MISEDVVLCIACGRPVEPGRAVFYDLREFCPECYSKARGGDPPAPPVRRPESEDEAVDEARSIGSRHA